jgi:hypothetical protein
MSVGHSTRSKGMAALAGCLMAALIVAVLLAVGSAFGSPSALAGGQCHRFSPGQPCLGPIVAEYNYEDRFSGGATWLFKASFGPIRALDAIHPFNTQRIVSWHPVRGVTMVAAFIVTRTNKPKLRFHYKRVPTGPHSGHVTLTSVTVNGFPTAPLLLLEGSKAGVNASAHQASRCIFRGVPCLGDLETYYAFNGNTAGATRSLVARLGPEEPAGINAQGDPLVKRKLHWRTSRGVKLVAAFEVIAPSEHHVHIRRLATGAHSGEVTFTIATSPTNHRPIGQIPVLLLEGTRTG